MPVNRYPWHLLPRIASEIENCRPDGAKRDLDELLLITAEQNQNLTAWKLRCAQISSAMLRGALRGGAAGDMLMEEHIRLVDDLCSIKGREELKRFLHHYLNQLLEHVRSTRRTNIEHAVDQIRKKIRRSLDAPRSLAEYARLFNVSTGHLSRSFCKIAGCSFREEVRRARIEAAIRLLSHTPLKISVIAQKLGLRDPSQFIADFRAEQGVTPGEYRRMHYRRQM